MYDQDISFYNSRGQRLAGRLYESTPHNDRGVIFCHGLFSSKDGYKITRMAEHIVRWGYNLLTFDFAYAGESEGSLVDMSFMQSCDDLSSAVRFFQGRGVRQIHLMGSSMGGAVSVYFSSENNSLINSLIAIATPLDLVDLIVKNAGIQDIHSLPPDGTTSIENIPIRNSFFKEVYTVDLVEAVRKIDVPVFIIHGKDDMVVPVENACIFEKNVKSLCKTLLLEKGDHNLTNDRDLHYIIQNVRNWLCSFISTDK